MGTQISGRGGHREGAGRPGEDSSSVRISLKSQQQAAELAAKMGLSKRQVIEDAICELHQKYLNLDIDGKI